MPERIQITVEAKDAATGVLRAITSQFGALGRAVNDGVDVFKAYNDVLKANNAKEAQKANEQLGLTIGRLAETVATELITSLKEAVNTTVEYAAEVRNLAQISGTTTEQASRFIQVLDDYGLSADDATQATRTLTRQGLTPTIETLAKLSDQYRAANTVQEKNKIIIDNLGRSGLQWVNVLNQGSEALLEQGAAVDASLVLTEKAVQQARDYEIALDNWDDAVQGLKVSIGSGLLPPLTDMLTVMDDSHRAAELAAADGVKLGRATGELTEKYMALARSERESQTAMKLSGQAADSASQDYGDLIKTIMTVSRTTQAEMPKIAYQNLLASLSVDGLTEAELAMATQAGLALGIFDQSAADSAKALEELNRKFAAGEISAKQYAAAVRSIPTNVSTTITLNLNNQTGSYVGDPSGGADLDPSTPYARGGYVRGPGTEYSDSINARLSNGEYVVNADATKQNKDLLDAINNGMQTSGGQTNIFYGAVTLNVDESGGGLLTLR